MKGNSGRNKRKTPAIFMYAAALFLSLCLTACTLTPAETGKYTEATSSAQLTESASSEGKHSSAGDTASDHEAGHENAATSESAAGQAKDGNQNPGTAKNAASIGEVSSIITDLLSGSGRGDFSLSDVPAYSGTPYCEVNGNEPFFNEADLSNQSFEQYSDLDAMGRCGTALANVGQDIMPTEPRGEIGMIKPSGWHTVKYDFVDGHYLYNRCHLIAYELAAENANEKNLITGTRYMNTQGMLPFENEVADYVKDTENHVLYRVTPVFDGDNPLATGVLMEAESDEDHGAGIRFNVFVYNVQPGVTIDYATGESQADGTVTDGSGTGNGNGDGTGSAGTGGSGTDNANGSGTGGSNGGGSDKETPSGITYVLNTNTMKFHRPSCSSVPQIKEKNREDTAESRDELIAEGYTPCRNCNP